MIVAFVSGIEIGSAAAGVAAPRANATTSA